MTVNVTFRRPFASGGLACRVVLVALAVALTAAGCASQGAVVSPTAPGTVVRTPGFAFAADTFAFPNEIRSRHPDVDDLYANYCFVLARGLRQFFQFARFDPDAPRLDRSGYVARIRQIAAHHAWEPALPLAERVVIPGYASLRELSGAEAEAVKEALGGRFWSLVHWTNWRVTFRVSGEHQASVSDEIAAELQAGRLVQLLVTNWPVPELNHTVVAFAYRDAEPDRVFEVWDPNDPARPGTLTFHHGERRFWASHLYDTRPGPIRVFRMYYSRML